MKQWLALSVLQLMSAGVVGVEVEVTKTSTVAEFKRLSQATDHVIPMSDTEFVVPAKGNVEYQYFVVDPELQEDRWVSAVEVVPGNPRVVQQAIVFVRPLGEDVGRGNAWLAAYLPGRRVLSLPKGFGRHIPAGSKLVFQIQYRTTGSTETDMTYVGLKFVDTNDVRTEVFTHEVLNQDFEIPPAAPAHIVSMAESDFPAGSSLLAITPHMHVRGSRFQIRAIQGPTTKILLDVPHYDFQQQLVYPLAKPFPLDGVRIECTATFDNSASNPANPDPTATVHWGEQIWEEMAQVYLDLTIPRSETSSGSTDPQRPDQITAHDAKHPPSSSVDDRAKRDAERFFEKLDANKDRSVSKQEAPKALQVFAFKRIDLNRDDRLSWDEVLTEAKRAIELRN